MATHTNIWGFEGWDECLWVIRRQSLLVGAGRGRLRPYDNSGRWWEWKMKGKGEAKLDESGSLMCRKIQRSSGGLWFSSVQLTGGNATNLHTQRTDRHVEKIQGINSLSVRLFILSALHPNQVIIQEFVKYSI